MRLRLIGGITDKRMAELEDDAVAAPDEIRCNQPMNGLQNGLWRQRRYLAGMSEREAATDGRRQLRRKFRFARGIETSGQ